MAAALTAVVAVVGLVVVSVVMVGRLVEWNIAVVDATPVAGNKTNLLPAYAQVNSYAYSKMEFVKTRWYSSKIKIPLYDTYDSIFEDLCSVDLKYYASSCEGQPYVRQQRHNMVFSCINLTLNSSCTVSTLVQCLHFYVVRTYVKKLNTYDTYAWSLVKNEM